MEEELTMEARRGLGECLIESSPWTRKTKMGDSERKPNASFIPQTNQAHTDLCLFGDITFGCVCCLSPGGSFSLMRAVLSLVGPGIGHGERGIYMTAG